MLPWDRRKRLQGLVKEVSEKRSFITNLRWARIHDFKTFVFRHNNGLLLVSGLQAAASFWC